MYTRPGCHAADSCTGHAYDTHYIQYTDTGPACRGDIRGCGVTTGEPQLLMLMCLHLKVFVPTSPHSFHNATMVAYS